MIFINEDSNLIMILASLSSSVSEIYQNITSPKTKKVAETSARTSHSANRGTEVRITVINIHEQNSSQNTSTKYQPTYINKTKRHNKSLSHFQVSY
jgi:hypothetical protein